MVNTYKNSTDIELVQKVTKNGDQEAFGELYDRHCSRVYNKCITFTNSAYEAEDLTHDVFLKAFLKLSSFKQNSSFYTWLYSITYNSCIDYSRKRSSDSQDITLAANEVERDEAKAYYEKTEDELLQIKVGYLKKVLADLESPDKMILLMKYQDDMSITDIQDVFGVSESAVKMRLLRARERALTIYKRLTKNP
ncbi:RNA polymerase sigma factor [Rhodohalobacter sp. 8-1]|uniref:RNA polymerase sigma factor n=1 Tax=Rhodohalobacter sp. 8-1 TaxID=3131972 RepID=UPI0030EF1AEA